MFMVDLRDSLYKNSGLVYTLLIVLVFIDRLNGFLNFSIIYTDSDQTLMWQVAQDLMRGEYHGPCFYGQSYNPIIEPIVSLPFLYLGLDYHVALPLTTALLGLAPFIILSVYFFKKVGPFFGLLPLFILLLLPPEYAMLTSITRGFVTGVFFAAIGLVLFYSSKSAVVKCLAGVMLGVALFANPNSVLLFPLLIPVLWNSRTDTIPLTIGFLIGLLPLYFNNEYYLSHPEMIVHGSPVLDLSASSFMRVINKLDNYFNFIAPVLWLVGWLSLLSFVLIAVRLWKKDLKLESVTVCICFAAIILSFFVSKATDGTNSVFFSGSRMYLAYPIILLFVFIYFLRSLSEDQRKKAFGILLVLTVISVPVKIFGFKYFIENTLKGSKNSIVKVEKIEDLRKKCKELKSFDKRIDLVLANSPDTPDQPITYGCPCLVEDFPQTIQPLFERRTWLMSSVMNGVYPKVLVHGQDTARWNKLDLEKLKIIQVDSCRRWVLIDNKLQTVDLIKQLGIK